jgi:hypothetical protein
MPKWPEKDFYSYDSKEATFKDKALYSSAKALAWTINKSTKSAKDAISAYRHYLHGSGQIRWFDYRRAYEEDAMIKYHVECYIIDACKEAERLRKKHNKNSFTMYGTKWEPVSNPLTDNWLYAIGKHRLWSFMQVTYNSKTGQYSMKMYLQAKDKYNFNKGMKDVLFGIKDDISGRLEEVGLARSFWQIGSLSHSNLKWKEGTRFVKPSKPNSAKRR